MGKNRKQLSDEEKHSLLVQQDIQLAKALAGNDSKLRYRALKNLKTWLVQRSLRMPLTDDDMKRVWKGLFYTMWMSDKPLVQEECAENISNLVHFSSTPQESLRFFKFGLTVLAIEWFGIDQIRLDKFMMFTRRLIRQGLVVLKNNDWDEELVDDFGDILSETVLKEDNKKHLALTLNIIELFLEELAKVSNGELEEDLVTEFLKPFVKFLSYSVEERQIEHTCEYLFYHLLRQSDEGIEYQQQFDAWRQQGFPGGTIDSMKRLENGDADEEESEDEQPPTNADKAPLDPRAGKVDVELPQLKFNPQQIVDLLKEFKFVKGSTSKTRKAISKLMQEFGKLAEGQYPLGMKEIPTIEADGYSTKVKASAQRLMKFEEELMNDNRKGKKRSYDDAEPSNNQKKHKINGKIAAKKGKIEKEPEVSHKSVKLNEKRKRKTKMEEDDVFENKLTKFIDKSEGNILNCGKRRVANTAFTPKIDQNFVGEFTRNSGTWYVSKHTSDSSDNSFISTPITTITPTKNIGKTKIKILQNIVLKGNESPDESMEVCSTVKTMQCSKSPEKVLPSGNDAGTERLFANKERPISTTPAKPKKRQSLFCSSEWDLPVKEGETEIFIPYRKHSTKANNKKQNEVRYSLDSNLRKQSLLRKNPTMSERKIKFNLNLNSSQEFYEHHEQIRNSPEIPWNANMKPSKPLLKPHTLSTPINPFYRYKSKAL